MEQRPKLGPVVAQSLLDFAAEPRNQALVAALAQELQFTAAAAEKNASAGSFTLGTGADGSTGGSTTTGELQGKRVVFTGSLQSMKRAQARAATVAAGQSIYQ